MPSSSAPISVDSHDSGKATRHNPSGRSPALIGEAGSGRLTREAGRLPENLHDHVRTGSFASRP